MKNLTIKPEDFSISDAGLMTITNKDLQAKIEKLSTEIEDALADTNNGCNYSAGCGVAVA